MDKMTKNIILISGGALVIVWVFNQTGLSNLFGPSTPSVIDTQNQQNSQAATTATQADINTTLSNQYTATFNDSSYLTYANQIYSFCSPGFGGAYNYADTAKTLMLMQNDLDVAKLIVAFGSRDINEYTTHAYMGLLEAVDNCFDSSNLGFGTASTKQSVINDWKKKGITYVL